MANGNTHSLTEENCPAQQTHGANHLMCIGDASQWQPVRKELIAHTEMIAVIRGEVVRVSEIFRDFPRL
jgi:hypothetical protein